MTDPLELLRAALADRYCLDRELGAGGMATVVTTTQSPCLCGFPPCLAFGAGHGGAVVQRVEGLSGDCGDLLPLWGKKP